MNDSNQILMFGYLMRFAAYLFVIGIIIAIKGDQGGH